MQDDDAAGERLAELLAELRAIEPALGRIQPAQLAVADRAIAKLEARGDAPLTDAHAAMTAAIYARAAVVAIAAADADRVQRWLARAVGHTRRDEPRAD